MPWNSTPNLPRAYAADAQPTLIVVCTSTGLDAVDSAHAVADVFTFGRCFAASDFANPPLLPIHARRFALSSTLRETTTTSLPIQPRLKMPLSRPISVTLPSTFTFGGEPRIDVIT